MKDIIVGKKYVDEEGTIIQIVYKIDISQFERIPHYVKRYPFVGIRHTFPTLEFQWVTRMYDIKGGAFSSNSSLMYEYVDWSKVKEGTPIIIKAPFILMRRYFVKYQEGRVYYQERISTDWCGENVATLVED